jgi:putative membrane protein
MTLAALFAFLHHLAAFSVVAALVTQFVLIRDALTIRSARRLQVTDMVLGISATVLLAVGLLRVFYFEKGADYYFHTWAFHAKLTLFVLVALASIIPTIEFLSWRTPVKNGQVPKPTAEKMRLLRTIIHAELAGVVLIILFAALMAKGIGSFG